MGTEIERKFLVVNDSWRVEPDAPNEYIVIGQGYLFDNTTSSLRIRQHGISKAFLTIKTSDSGDLLSRKEFEYEIPWEDAEDLISMCPSVIKKHRFRVGRWEIDEFLGDNQGLFIAEIELQHPDEDIVIPDFVGEEVTNDERYYNTYLARFPYQTWLGMEDNSDECPECGGKMTAKRSGVECPYCSYWFCF